MLDTKNTKENLMLVATIEGWSFLILLFIAMPLKYMFDIPIATKIIGMIHGGLFVWFLVALYSFHKECAKGFGVTLYGFVASLIPFGTFFFNKKLATIEC